MQCKYKLAFVPFHEHLLWICFLTLSCLPISHATKLPFVENHAKVLAEAKRLGAPMQAIARAMQEAQKDLYPMKEVITVFDLSQPTLNKRLYVLDFRFGNTTAHHASHGRGNGGITHATKFSGFWKDNSRMVPLGPLRTAQHPIVFGGTESRYSVVFDRYRKKEYRDQLVLDMDGMCHYNYEINLWQGNTRMAFHTNWYNTQGYRETHQGLGRSLGCITLDPIINNRIVKRIAGGSLVYVTVGNDPISKYTGGAKCR